MSRNPDFELNDNVGRTGDHIRSYNAGAPTEDDLRRWAARADPTGDDEHRPGPGTQPPAAPTDPPALPERADLAGFAEALADRLPGTWSVGTREDAGAEEQFGVAQLLWDDGEVSRAYGQFPLREALLTSSDGDDLLVIDRPQRAHQFLVGALLPRQPMRVGSVEAPHGIVVGDDPAQAAHAVATRLLPRYHHAVHHVRTELLAFALHQGHQAVSDWKTVARPLRAAGYWPPDVRWQVPLNQRNAAVWSQFAVFLDHGAALLDRAESAVPRLAADAGQAQEWTAQFGTLRDALLAGRGLRDVWEKHAEAVRTSRPTRSRDDYASDGGRYAIAWSTMSQWLNYGDTLLEICQRVAALPAAAAHEHTARVEAAQARSASATRAAAAPVPQPPARPDPGSAPRPRSR